MDDAQQQRRRDDAHNQQQRREDDRDRVWNARLDTMERNHVELAHQVAQLDTKMNLVQLEQSHLKELVGARLSTIEKTQEVGLTKMDGISREIGMMANDPKTSPMGRTIIGYCQGMEASIAEQSDTLTAHAKTHKEIVAWQNQVNGVLVIMKWVGAGGLVALGFSILRILKLLP